MSQFLVELLLKSTALLLIPAAMSLIQRRTSADLRGKITVGVFVALASLPLALALGPEIVIWQTSPQTVADSQPLSMPARNPDSVAPVVGSVADDSNAPATPVDLLYIGLAIYGLTTLLWLCLSAHRYWRTNRTVRALAPVEEPEIRRQFDKLQHELCPRRKIRLCWQDSSASTVSWGLVKSTIGLPADFTDWSSEKRKAALIHELAHVMRNDCRSILFARLVVTMYWWHPLSWKALAGLRGDIECATDDQVLRYGVPAKPYARYLVEVASRNPPSVAFGMAMARRNETLRSRISALVATRQRRNTMTKPTQIIIWLAGVASVLLVSSLQVAAAPTTENDRESIRLYSAAPTYPKDALADGIEGYVDLEFDITEEGSTENIRILNQVPDSGEFGQSAVEAMRTFRYLPRIEGGVAAAEQGVKTRLQFTLAPDGTGTAGTEAPAEPSDIAQMANTITQSTFKLRSRLNEAALAADRNEDGERFLDLAEETYRAQPEMASYFLLRATQLGTSRADKLTLLKAMTLYELGDLERSLALFTQIGEDETQAEVASSWIARIDYEIRRRELVYEELLSQR